MSSSYRIVGTAGHIDHGKSALVRALTGIDPDRLQEEKDRGITIDLGFADATIGDLQIGFIDVPGHERFVKNMLAGVGGIDAVLMVVAGDESIMPQTREHFAIARLLGIRAGVVAITKCDLADPETLELVEMEVEELLAGSPLATSPIVHTSIVDDRGLDSLRARLREVLAGVPARAVSGMVRLPVDRVFSVRGFGTVVTGTLLGGEVHVGDRLEVVPGGKVVTVRGVQVHGTTASGARAGQRAALNLQGIAVEELHRGLVLTAPASLPAVAMLDARIEVLAGAGLEHLQRVRVHHGAAEILGRVALLDAEALAGGASGLVQIRLERPYPAIPGDRFIVRRYSPVTTIGGGTVIDTASRRHRRGSTAANRLRRLEAADAPGRLALLVAEAGMRGVEAQALSRRLGIPPLALQELLATAEMAGTVLVVGTPPLAMRPADMTRLEESIESAVAAYHERWPLRPAMPKEELRQGLVPQPTPAVLDAAAMRLTAGERLRPEADGYALGRHVARLRTEDVALSRDLLDRYERAALAPPAADEILGAGDESRREVYHYLLRSGELVRVRDDQVLHHETLAKLIDAMTSRFARGEQFSVGEFKDWAGITRRHAIPLLEYLDSRRITRRVGDLRERL